MDSRNAPSQIPIEAALRAVAERQRRELGPHLDTDELVDYHAGTLSEEAAERVRDHLTLCPECAGRLLDLEAFRDAAPAGAPDPDAEAAWRELAPRLGEEREKAPLVRFPRRSGSPALPWALAAALLLSVIGLSMRVATLGREVRELSQLEAGAVAPYRLLPTGEEVRGSEARSAPLSSQHTAQVVLSPPPDGWPAGQVELEIRGPGSGGPVLWRLAILPDDKRDLVVTLKAGTIPPGTYRVRAYRGPQLAPIDYELPIVR